MLERIFPRSLDNDYSGYRTALWILGLVIAVRALQSTMIIFNGYNTVVGADGIPLDTYPADAAQNVMALFAMISIWRLLFSLLAVIVLVRYRSAVPLMFLLLLLHYGAVQLLSIYMPLVRTGRPAASIVNLVIAGLIVAGFVLSVLRRRRGLISN